MPRCEGRPCGPCPAKVNNATVKHSQGDLMLCKDCDEFRFPRTSTKPVTKEDTKPGVKSDAYGSDNDSVSAAAGQTVQVQAQFSAQPVKASEAPIVNELLFFVMNKFDSRRHDNVQSVIAEFYREDEIMTAKQLLLNQLDVSQHPTIHPYTRKRIGENKHDRTAEDIVNIVSYLDENDFRELLPTFCAANMSRIPLLPDDMSDMAAVRYELTRLKQQVDVLVKCMMSSSGHTTLLPASLEHSSANYNAAVSTVNGNNMDLCCSTAHQDLLSMPQLSTSDRPPVGDANSCHQSGDQPTDFANMVKKNCDSYQNMNNYTTVVNKKQEHKKNKKAKIIVGNAGGEGTLKGVAQKAVVCVNRLQVGTTVDEVTTHLNDAGVKVFSCFEVTPKPNNVASSVGETYSVNTDSPAVQPQPKDLNRKFTSMRVCVPQVQLKAIFDANIWPVGVIVRPWSFKPKVASSDSDTVNRSSQS